MTPEKCPHCGMAWNEAMGEYECGSYPAGSSVVRATACTEISRLQAQLAQAERVVVPELTEDDAWGVDEAVQIAGHGSLPFSRVAYAKAIYNLAASRANSVPASRVLKDGEVAVGADLVKAYEDLHKWATYVGYDGSVMDRLDALRAQGKEGAQ